MSHIKKNYNKECNELVTSFSEKKSLLLHVCCAPCSSSVLLRLKDFFTITLFFYNPNIFPQVEYLKRKEELITLLEHYQRDVSLFCTVIDADYNHDEFLTVAKDYATEKEGGLRCKFCYELRIKKTFELASSMQYDYFCTTLSISPLKNAMLINEIGFSLQNSTTKWLPSDFKKQNGFLRSIELSKTYNLYRQDTCGCEFSKNIKQSKTILTL